MLGWFGPRGLASILFLAVVLQRESGGILHLDLIADITIWTVALSVVLHGVTAVPLAERYGRAERAANKDAL
jgi:NhaP-type Na+/H+ or K+/H+ antiporter